MVFRATGGSVFFTSGGNIDFGGVPTPLEINSGGTLTLMRFDDDGGLPWAVQAVHRGR